MTKKERLREELKRLKDEFREMVAEYIANNPTMTYAEIGAKIGISVSEVARISKAHSTTRAWGGASTAAKGKDHE